MPNHGILDTLTPNQQGLLLFWIENYPIEKVIVMVADPNPPGFGIVTHVTTLRRFYRRVQVRQLQAELTEAMPALTPPQTADLERAATSAVTNYAFETMTMPGKGASNFEHITKWLVALRDRELAAERNAIQRERLAHSHRKLQLAAAVATASMATNDTRKMMVTSVECIFGTKMIQEQSNDSQS